MTLMEKYELAWDVMVTMASQPGMQTTSILGAAAIAYFWYRCQCQK